MTYLCDNDEVHDPHSVVFLTGPQEDEVYRCMGVQELSVDPQPEGQPPITGYITQLPEAIDLVNKIKGYENDLGDLLAHCQNGDVYADPRMVELARANLQQGFMWLVRSIFQPESRL